MKAGQPKHNAQDRTNRLLIRELMQKYNLLKASVYRYLELDPQEISNN
jgi:hypothetical protein